MRQSQDGAGEKEEKGGGRTAIKSPKKMDQLFCGALGGVNLDGILGALPLVAWSFSFSRCFCSRARRRSLTAQEGRLAGGGRRERKRWVKKRTSSLALLLLLRLCSLLRLQRFLLSRSELLLLLGLVCCSERRGGSASSVRDRAERGWEGGRGRTSRLLLLCNTKLLLLLLPAGPLLLLDCPQEAISTISEQYREEAEDAPARSFSLAAFSFAFSFARAAFSFSF